MVFLLLINPRVIIQHGRTMTTDSLCCHGIVPSCIHMKFHQEVVPYDVVPHYYVLGNLCHRTESITKLTFFFAQYYNLWNVTLCQSWCLQSNAFVSNVKSMSVCRGRAVPSAVTRLPPGLRASSSHRHLQ